MVILMLLQNVLDGVVSITSGGGDGVVSITSGGGVHLELIQQRFVIPDLKRISS